jgi:hypothetical protein
MFKKFPISNLIFSCISLNNKNHSIPFGFVVTKILDSAGKQDLHFLVGVELLSYVFVNIPHEKIYIGVFTFIYFIFY